jgi:ATP-dependent phosphoenolpyruvate carboxykinase
MCLSDLEYLQISTSGKMYANLSVSDLVECALKRGEGTLSDKGALVIHTGKYTGRSPKDRFIVKHSSIEDKVNWNETNMPLDEKVFENTIKEIIVPGFNEVIFIFYSEQRIQRSWQDKSRRESWSDELRCRASMQEVQRRKQVCQLQGQ